MTWTNRWDAYLEDHPGTREETEDRDVLRIVRDNQIVITAERGPFDSAPARELFSLGWFDADLDPELPLIFDSTAYGDNDEPYHDAYTARWFPLASGLVSCGNRKDLPKKQRIHDYVSLGIDTKNRGEKGICEVIVFACSRCGKDWRE